MEPATLMTPNDPNDSDTFPQDGVLEVCDVNNDGIENVDLTVMDAYYTNGNPVYSVSYFLTQADADNNAAPLASPFTNYTNPQTIFVRIENINTQIYQTSILTLVVQPSPDILQGTSLTNCDGDGDGFAEFDITQANDEILQGQVGENFIITYHETQAEADSGANPIVSPNSYTNIVSNIQTIFVRVESTTGNCASIGVIELIVDSGC